MKKVLKVIFLVAMLMTFALAVVACGNNSNEGDTTGQATEPTTTEAGETEGGIATTLPATLIRVALIAHSPDSILDDGSFNQGAWDGVQRFASQHGLGSDDTRFFQPHSADDAARIALMEEAIGSGYNVLVLPGFHFIESVYEAQDYFPDVRFILLDAIPAGPDGVRIEPNVVAIEYDEHEAGFLAGYAAVIEGFRNLGFTGGIAVPAVVRFGHGFIQGAEHAANELGLGEGDVTINYHYFGLFAPSPEFQTIASSWFAAGTEVIFSAAGGANGSVIAAAEAQNSWAIGVDVDQGWMSERVISSAMKALNNSVYDMLTDILNNSFNGGRAITFNATNNGIGLPMESSRWQNFTQTQYDAIFSQLSSGSVRVDGSLDMTTILNAVNLVIVNEL